MALHLLKRRAQTLDPLIEILQKARDQLRPCQACGFWDENDPCQFCTDPRREQETICVVADMGDVWAVERSGSYRGLYHVLGGLLSMVEGVSPEQLRIQGLIERCIKVKPSEVILALSPTIEGQTTAHYLTQDLKKAGIQMISTLARGLPLGGELDYLDDGTLNVAFTGRKNLP